MRRIFAALTGMTLCLAACLPAARAAQADPQANAAMAPGAGAAPSVAASRGAVRHGHMRAHHAGAHLAPGAAASPSVSDNRGSAGAVSRNAPPASATNGQAGGAASVAHDQAGTPAPR